MCITKICSRLCCDPHKLAYVSAFITGGEAILFGVLNLTLILMKLCVIVPDRQLGADLDKIWSWYFFDDSTCDERHGDLDLPGWIDVNYPLADRPNVTSVDANFGYQIAYLVLHTLWLISAPVLIYGNARKRWGFYVPWLLIAFALIIMDVVLAAFFIIDMTDIDTGSFSDESPIIWMITMYLRGVLIWFTNVTQAATVLNAFCKSRHKRVKQERQKKKQQKKHDLEMTEATAAAAAEARAEAQAEAAKRHAQASHTHSAQQPVVQQVHVEHHHHGIENVAFAGAPQDPYARTPTDHYPYIPQNPPPYAQNRNPPPSKAPKEVRPFSYLNPGFRPNDPNDVVGMKRNPAPGLPEANANTRGQGYFTALPPRDYDYDDDDGDMASLPRVNSGKGGGSIYPTAPRDSDFPPPYDPQQSGPAYNVNASPYPSNNYY